MTNEIKRHNYLDRIERKILTALTERTTPMHLCLFENTLDLRHSKHTNTKHAVLHSFTHSTMLYGMSPTHWQSLDNKIRTFAKENPKCKILPNP